MEARNDLDLSVVIPARNCARDLACCLDSLGCAPSTPSIADHDLRTQSVSAQGLLFEVIVVDDASDDQTAEVATSYGARVVRLAEQSGPAAARNRGVGKARSDLVCFLDADVQVHAGTLQKIRAAFDDESLDAVFGSYDKKPTQGNLVSQFRNLLHHYVHQSSSERALTFWAGCGAIKKSVFEEYGGFLEKYQRPCIEDVELGGRLTGDGRRIALKKDVQVAHAKHWNLWRVWRTDVFDRGIPWTRLLLKSGLPNDLNLKHSQRASVLLVSVLLVLLAIGSWQNPVALVYVVVCTSLIAIADRVDSTTSKWIKPTAVAWLIAAGFLVAVNGWTFLSGLGVIGVVCLNADLYRFWLRERGLGSTVLYTPLHLLYFFSCGISLAAGVVLHTWDGLRIHWEGEAPAEPQGTVGAAKQRGFACSDAPPLSEASATQCGFANSIVRSLMRLGGSLALPILALPGMVIGAREQQGDAETDGVAPDRSAEARAREQGSSTMFRRYVTLAGAELAATVLSAFSLLFVMSQIGAAGFGEVSLAASIALFLAMFAIGGSETFAVREASANPDVVPRLAPTLILLRLLAVGLFFGLITLALWATSTGPWMSLIAWFAAVQAAAALSPTWVPKALEQTNVLAKVNVVRQVVSLSVLLAALTAQRLWMVPVALACAEVVAALLLWQWVGGQEIRLARPLPIRQWPRLLHGCLSIGASKTFRALSLRADLIILALFVSMTQVGVYAGAYRLFHLGLSLVGVYCVVLLPRLVKRQGPELFAGLLGRVVPWVLISATGLGLVIEALVRIPSVHLPIATGPMWLLACSLVAMVVGEHFRQALFAHGEERIELRWAALALVVHVAAKLCLIPTLGVAGAALGTLVGETVYLAVAGATLAWSERGPEKAVVNSHA